MFVKWCTAVQFVYKSTHRGLNITNQAPALQSARESLPGQRPRACDDNFRIFQDFEIKKIKSELLYQFNQ